VAFSNTTLVSLSISSVTPSIIIRTLEEKRSVVGALLVEDWTGEMEAGAIDGSRGTVFVGLLLNFSSNLDGIGVAVVLDVTGVAVGSLFSSLLIEISSAVGDIVGLCEGV
jgi:hypothetical protein